MLPAPNSGPIALVLNKGSGAGAAPELGERLAILFRAAGRQVLVAKGGEVEGDVVTREAIIGGEVRGTVVAEERVEIQATSVVHGDIASRRLLVHEGGEINGVVRMGEEAAAPQAAAPAAATPAGSY